MKLEEERLRQLASLAGLELAPEEEADLARQLEGVLGWMAALEEAEEAEPTKSPGLRRRDDQEGLRVRPDELLRLAAEREGRLVRVPPGEAP